MLWYIFNIQKSQLTSDELCHTKNTNNLPNTITMVAEPFAPPVALIWQIHAAWGVGGLDHVFLEAAVEEFYQNH